MRVVALYDTHTTLLVIEAFEQVSLRQEP